MGASGAGKSTLMNILAHRNQGNLTVTGTVLLNGEEGGTDIGHVSAYVQQEDLFVGTLTVKEHLIFHALLRLRRSYTTAQRVERVENVIQELGLAKCSDTLIGIPGKTKSLSGGEKKRLSFASEILTNPPLLFVDEPTSGLDSFHAENVVSALRGMSVTGRTILCTIHQPASEVYAMFDRLLLLAEGRTVYLGKRKEAVAHFENLGYKCPENYNPADFFVHTLAIIPTKQKECRQRVKTLADAFRSRQNASELQQSANEQSTEPPKIREELRAEKGFKATLLTQFTALFRRAWITNIREPNLLRVKFVQTLFTAILVGLVYLQVGRKTEQVQNINGALFFFVTQMSLTNMFSVIQALPLEMPVFLRERGNKMYRISLYFLCKTLSEVPFNIGLPLFFVIPAYWMIGLKETASSFFFCYLILVFVGDISQSAGYIVSAMSSTVPVALALGPAFVMPFLLFGGLFIKSSEIPVYFDWIRYINWFYYGFEGLVINEWRDTDVACSINTVGCLPNGTVVIESLGFKEEHFRLDLVLLGVLIVAARLIAYIVLRIRVLLSKT
ncbi:protein white-like [Corticium candelabrum]|uniref:protein white-like n=1 Tax=Corticium candelabrum TaxID=121492 RepID=UPI002E26BA92|nr:protein white-like [Corticium candelabrum]